MRNCPLCGGTSECTHCHGSGIDPGGGPPALDCLADPEDLGENDCPVCLGQADCLMCGGIGDLDVPAGFDPEAVDNFRFLSEIPQLAYGQMPWIVRVADHDELLAWHAEELEEISEF